MDDRDIFLIEVARRGRDGDYAGAAEVATLQGRATALEARVDITSLDAVPDVNAAGPTDGQALVWDAGASAWVPGSAGGSIESVWQFGTNMANNVYYLNMIFGLQTALSTYLGKNVVSIAVDFAGTGSATTVARSDHNHTTASITRGEFAPTGYMSSGTRTLKTENVTLASGVAYLVKARLKPQMRGADSGAAYYTMTVTINGNARTSTGGSNGFWCVQGVPNKEEWAHHQAITGTGAAITITGAVTYHSGAGFNVDAGELEIELIPNR